VDGEGRDDRDDLEMRAWAVKVIQALNAKLQVLRYDLHCERVLGVAFTPDGERCSPPAWMERCGSSKLGAASWSIALPIPRLATWPFRWTVSSRFRSVMGPNQSMRIWDLESGKEVAPVYLTAPARWTCVLRRAARRCCTARLRSTNSMRLF